MSIIDFVEMTIFLYVICFSVYTKIQNTCKNGRQKCPKNDFWQKVADDPTTMGVKNFVEVALSRTITETIVYSAEKFKMATKNDEKTIFGENCQLTLPLPWK